jgi:hypothetical protein
VTSNVVAVAAGCSHSLFVKADGTLWAVGYNAFGQLGNGNTTAQHSPVLVTNNVVAVAGGAYHSLFVKAGGTLWAMGVNNYGQLGIGNITGTNRPVSVAGLTVASLGAMDQAYHSLAVAGRAPQFTGPTNQAVGLGQPFTFAVTVTNGDGPFTCQWQLNGTNILNATNASYTVASAAFTNAGTYAATVNGVVGSTSQSASLTVRVIPTITNWPTASTITYGQTLAGSTLSGGSASVPGIFAFTTPSTAPGVGTASQSVTFTPTDTTDYTTASSTVSVTVIKATSKVTTWPTAAAITYGQTLASAKLSGGSATPTGGSFAFTTPSTAPGAGTASQGVTFTPKDTTDYNTTNWTVNVTVNKATSKVTTWPTAAAIAYGQTLASATLSGGASTPVGSFAFTTPSTAPAVGTASQNVTFTPTDTTDYTTVSGSVSVTVNKATPTVTTWPTAAAITYGQTLASATLSGGSATPAGSFAFNTPSTAPGAGTASQNVTFTPTDTTHYTTVSGSVSVTVNKATSTVTTWPTATAITYGQTLASATLSGGSATPAGSFAFTTPSTAPGAGTASQNVTFTPTDTADYNTASSTVSVTVIKATSTVTTWPTAAAITYGQTLASAILSGGSATPAGSFAFTTPSTAPAVGTASQGVTFMPTDTTDYNTTNWTVSVTVNQASATVTLSGLSQTYTGNAISATAGTMPSGLTVNLTYNGSASAPTNVGSYNVIGAISDASYQGSATNTLVINSVTNLVAAAMNLGVQAGQAAALPLVKLLLRSTDPFGQTLRVVSADPASAHGGAVVLEDSAINYTPANGYSGPDTFSYVIADTGGNTASGLITVTVTPSGSGSGGSYNQLAVETVGSAVRLSYLGIPGTNYALEVTHGLTPPITWTPVVTNPAAANGLLLFTNTPGGGQSFYRTRYVP